MQRLKNIFKWIILISLIVLVLYIFDYGYIFRGARIVYFTGHKTAFIDDYPYFENDTIKNDTPLPWPLHKNYNTEKETDKLNQVIKDWGSIAFLIIKNDSIWFENYYDGFDQNSKTNSFSMAKSMVTSLLGKAIMEGHIKNLDQPVTDFYPEYGNIKTTVGDLASMASGLNWVEHYTSPFSLTARANYDDDLAETILNLKQVTEPGQAFKYASGDTQLLGMIIQKATGKSLAKYLSESFWKPMGMTDDALWQVDDDHNRLAKAFCCVSSSARNFARFGKLYKDFGKWNGKQLLDSAYVVKSITPRFKNGPEYGYGWWLNSYLGKDFFMMRGHLGQYVIVQPEDNVIIVRLGHRKSPDKAIPGIRPFTDDIGVYVEEAYKMLNYD